MTVCVHGLGYIGLPTAAILATSGHEVVGFDTNPAVIERIEDGGTYPEEPGLGDAIERARSSGSLAAGTEPVPADYHLICVPTPLEHETERADLSAVEAAGETIGPLLREGDTVILESTVPPRTTEDVLRPLLEGEHRLAGRDFHLAHCPETVLPGRILAELEDNDRIVGGVDEASTEAAVALYESFVRGTIHRAPSPSTAEFVKLVQNTYRDVNIALANEIAKLAADYRVDSRAAIELANTHPRVDIHQPGPGVGGHCIPLDPWFLGQGSDRLDLIAHARRVNDGMAEYVVDLLLDALPDRRNPKVAVLGVAYKGNVDDSRESPGLAVASALQQRALPAGEQSGTVALDGGALEGVEVVLSDSHVTDQTLALQPLDDALDGADAVIITADHDEYRDLDPEYLAERMHGRLIVDTKAMLPQKRWRRAGFTVKRV